jgi:hypothetical protein
LCGDSFRNDAAIFDYVIKSAFARIILAGGAGTGGGTLSGSEPAAFFRADAAFANPEL